MEEAAELDFTESQYKAFKAKYSKYLYFPEHKDDYGAYMPFTNETMSLVVNENGRYMVGNRVIQLSYINSYEQLQETGQALYYDEKDIWKPTFELPTYELDKTTVHAYNINQAAWPAKKRKVGMNEYEFVHNWQQVGDGKKIRLTFGRILKTRFGNDPILKWHSEVSFRKKGFLGAWYNYKSYTSFSAVITYEDNTKQICRYSENGTSSHDGYYPCNEFIQVPREDYIVKNIYNGEEVNSIYPLRLYRFPAYKVDFTITYRGMPNPMYLTDNKPRLWLYTTTKDKLFDYQ